MDQVIIGILCLQLFAGQLNLPALAQTAPEENTAAEAANNLDLTSTEQNIAASSVMQAAQQANINVGDIVRTVTPTDMLTAAEMIAVRQVLATGTQYLQLSEQGVATGGGFRVSYYASGLNNLVIPEGVRVSQDAAMLQSLNLTGNLTNSGTFNIFSSNAAVTSASVNASNIYNNVTGTISSTLANLSLNAVNNIVNAGSIVSAGNLSMTAGGSIVNALPAGITAMSPVMQAANSMNLLSATIVNSGLMQALAGSMNIDTMTPGNIAVNNLNGVMEALNGAINIRDANFNLAHDITLSGGDFVSKQLNLYSGHGTIEVNVGHLTGELNSVAEILHLNADTPVLTLGNQCLYGDPTYVNTGAINIAGALTITGGPLVIIAGTNILSTSTSASITNSGNDIYLIAGATVNSGSCTGCANNGGTSISGIDPSGTGLMTAGTVTVDFASGTGGNIDFAGITAGSTGSTASIVINSSSATPGDGGEVVLAARANGATGGQILFPTATISINTSGRAPGSSGGDVTVIAGKSSTNQSNPTVQLGTVITADSGAALGTTSSTTTAGSVSIYAAQPTATSGTSVTFTPAGTYDVGSATITNSAGLATGYLQVATINTSGAGGSGGSVPGQGSGGGSAGNILMSTFGDVEVTGSLLAFGGGGGGGGNNAGGAGGSGGAISVSVGSNRTITISGDMNASGGGGGGGGGGTGAGGAAGSAGSLTLTAAGASASIGLAGNLYIYNGTAGTAGGSGGQGGNSYGGAGGGGAGNTGNAGSGGGASFGGGGAGGGGSATASAGGGGGGGGFGGGGGGSLVGATGGRGGTANGGGGGGDGGGNPGGTGGQGSNNGGSGTGTATGAPGGGGAGSGIGGNGGGMIGQPTNAGGGGGGNAFNGGGGGGIGSGAPASAGGQGGQAAAGGTGGVGSLANGAPGATGTGTGANYSGAHGTINITSGGLVNLFTGVSTQLIRVGAAAPQTNRRNATAAVLGGITAAELVLGSTSNTDGITIAGDFNITSDYDLTMSTGGNYTGAGQIITIGAKTLTATSVGTMNTGRIIGTNGFIYLTSSGTMTVSDNVTVGAGPGETYLVANSGSGIVLQGDVGLGNIASIIADGSITRSGGVVSGGDVILTATNGSVGTSGNPVVINTSTNVGRGLTFNATNGNAYINENDGARIKASQAGNTVVLNVNGNTTITGAVNAGTSLTIAATTGDITIEADVGSASTTTTTLTAQSDIFRTTGTVSGVNVNLTATTGTIGTDPAPIVTEAGSGAGQGVTLNATNATNGFIYARDLSAVRMQASTSGNYFQFRAAGAITVEGAITNGQNDGFLLETTAGNGAITLNANLVSTGGLTVATHGTGNIILAAGVTVSSNNNQMLFIANDMDFGGVGSLINAGTATVVMRANGNKSIVLAGAGGVFNLSAAELGNIRAGLLTLGNNSGGITVAGAINVSVGTPGTTNGAYNLNFTNNDNYTAAGQTITLGPRSLTVDVNGSMDTGTVTGNGATISLTAGNGMTVSGQIDAGNGSISLVTDTSGNINLGANVSTTGGGTTTINARGSILQTSGLVSGTHINLTAVTGSVGQDINNPISTNGGSNASQGLELTATAGSVYVLENSAVRIKASSALNDFSVSAGGTLVTEGTISAQTITLDTFGGIPSITLNGNVTSTGGPINITAATTGTITVGTGFDIVSSGGNITLTAHDVGFSGAGTIVNAGAGTVFLRANGDKTISVGGGSGVFIIAPADLANIIATTVDISDIGSVGGGITIAGPIDVSVGTPGTTAGAYNLKFGTLSTYTGAGQTITLGTRTMQVTVGGTLNTGTITGGATTVTLTSGLAMTVSGPVTVTGSGTVSLNTTNNSDITLSANVGGGATATISADNSIIQSGAGVVSGTNVNLTAVDGSIGTSAPNAPILTDAGSSAGQGLTLSATNGSLYVSDTGAVRILASQALNNFVVSASGTMTISQAIGASSFNLSTSAGGDIVISASIGSVATTISTLIANNSITRTGGTVFGTNVNLTATLGAIGTDPAPIVTEAGSLATQGLTLNATNSTNGFIYVRDLTAVRVQTSTSGNYFQLRSAGAMTVDGVLTNGQNDGFLLETTASNGNLNINASIVSTGGTTLATNGTGNIVVAAGVSISTNNNQLLLIANDMDFGGVGTLINVGNSGTTSNITIRPNGNKAMVIAGAGGVLNISSAELANIRAVNVAFGINSTSGGITIAGAVDVSTGTPGVNNGAYNLSFNNANNFSAAGQTITLGARTLTADVSGTLDSGTITGGNSSISLTSNLAMTVSGAVTLTAGSTNLITDGGGNIALQANVGGGVSTTVQAAGSITRTAGTVSGTNVFLTAGTGSIGTSSPDAPILVDAGASAGQGLQVTANSGSAYVTEANDVIVKTSTTGGAFVVKAGGSITTSGTLTNGGGGLFTLETTANNGAINLNNNIASTGPTLLSTQGTGDIIVLAGADIIATNQSILLRANNVDFGGVGTSINAGNNNVSLQTNGNKAIVVAGAGGVFNVSAAELANITATTLNINDSGNGGGITVAGSLDVSTGTPGTTAGAYNLSFANTGSYTASGQTITSGERTLTVDVDGTLTTGTVTGGSTTISLTGGTGLTVSGAVTQTGGTISLVTDTSGDIAISADIGGGATTTLNARNSITRTAGTVSGTNVDLTATNGAIGTNPAPIVTDAGSGAGQGLTLTANNASGGFIWIQESNDVRVQTSHSENFFRIRAAGSITTEGVLSNGHGDGLRLETTANNGSITLNANVIADGGTLMSTNGSGNFSMAPGVTLSTTNDALSIQANDVDFGGVGTSINVGTGDLDIWTNGNKSIVVGGAGGTFNISAAELANITTSNLNISDNTAGGGFTVAGAINVSVGTPGTNAGAYNLFFSNAGAYTAAGQTITLGSRTLSVTAGGTLNTGTVTGGNTTISLTGGTGLTVSGAVTLTAGTTTLATTASGNITISANVGGGATTTLNARNSIIRTAGTVTGTNVTLTAQLGAIGTDPAPIVTEAGNLAGQGLTMNATNSTNGFIYVRDLTAVRVQTSTSGNYFQLRSAGEMTVEGVLTNGQNDGFLLETTASNGNLNINANIVSTGGTTLATQGTGNIVVAAGVSISTNSNQLLLIANDMDFGGVGTLINVGNNVSTSNITIRPNGIKSMFVGGAGGILNISSAELANIRAVNVAFGISSTRGGITIAGTVDVSTGTPGVNNGAYNLSFNNTDNFSAAGQSIILGARTLSSDVSGTLDTGTITGGNSSISLTSNLAMTVSGAVTLTAGSINLITDGGGSIALQANVGGGVATTVQASASITRTAGTVSGTNVFLTAGTGSIGTSSPDAPIVTDAGASAGQGLQITANSGSAYVTEANDVILKTSTTGGAFVVKAGGSITTSGTLTNGGGGLFTLETTANNGAINVNNNLVSTGVTTLSTHGTGNITVLAGADITATNQNITLRANDLSFGGAGTSVSAGNATVFLQANGNKSIAISGAGGVFNISSAELANITATTLNINDNGNGGGITIAGAINVSAGTPGTTAGAYNLVFGNTGSYTAAGQTITLGTRTLNVTAGGTLDTGSVSGGTNSSITMAGGTGLTVSGNLTATGASSTITLSTTNSGDITVSANVSSNGTTELSAAGSIVRTAGTVSGDNINLNANSGSVGADLARIVIDTGITGGTGLRVMVPNGSVYVTETGAGRMRGTSTIGDSFTVNAGGSYILGGVVNADDVSVTASGLNSDVTVAGNVTGTTSIFVEAGNSILRTSDTLTGLNITLTALNGDIGVDTASGVIVTEAGGAAGQGLTLTATSGEVFVRDLSAVAVQTSTADGTLRVRSAGTITVEGVMQSTSGAVIVETTVNGASVNVNEDVLANQSINLIARGPGTVTVAAGALVRSTSGDIDMIARDVSFGGVGTSIQAAAGSVFLRTNDQTTISVGSTGSTFSVTAADLANITANSVTITDDGTVSNMTVTGSFTLATGTSGTTPGSFNLVLTTAGTYTGTGQTITANSNNLTVNATGTINTGGVTGVSSSVNFTSGSAVTISGNIENVGGSTEFNSGNNGNITIAGNVTEANSTVFNANGSGNILRSGANVITSNLLDLVSQTGDIGQLGTPIIVTVNTLSYSTTGSVHILSTQSVAVDAANIGGDLFLTATGTVTTNGNLSAQNIALTVLSLINGNTITATGPAGIIAITSPVGFGLTVTGSGTLIAPTTVSIIAADQTLTFSGDQNITGNGVIESIGTNGIITANPGVSIFASGNLAVSAQTAINDQSAFTAGGTVTFNIINPPPPPRPTPTTTESTSNLFGNFLSLADLSTITTSTRNDPVIIPTDQNQGSTGNSLSTALSTDLNTDSLSTLEWGDNNEPPDNGSIANLGVLSQAKNPGTNLNVPPTPTVDTGDIDLSIFGSLISEGPMPKDQPYKKVAFTTSNPNQEILEPAVNALQSIDQTIRVSAKRSNLIVFTSANQVTSGFIANNTDSILSGSPGTLVSTDKNTVALHTGRLLADNGKQPLTVFTNQAAIVIGLDSAAVIEVHPGAPVRVMSIAGKAPISVRTRDGSLISLSPGQEVIIGQTDLSDSDLLPTDGVNRNSHSNEGKIARDNFSLSEFLMKDDLVDNHARLQGHIAAAARKQPNNSPQPTKLTTAASGQPARILAEDNTEFCIKQSGQLRLYKGSLLVHSNDELAIDTPVGRVQDTKGIAIRLSAVNGKSRVQVLSGTKPVSIIAGKHIMPLKCGKEMFITNHKPTQQEAVPADEVGRRGMEAIALENGLGAVLGDFSIFSVLTSAKYMLPLALPASISEQRIHTQIIKSAAVIQHVFGTRGRYYVAPKEQAKSPIPDWVFKTTSTTDKSLPLLEAMAK